MRSEAAEYLEGEEAAIREHYAQTAQACAQWYRGHRHYYDQKVAVLKRLIPTPGRVLEVGCGLGQNLAGLAPEYGLGIDFSPEIMEEARALHPAPEYPNLEFRCLSASECATLGQTFDTILLVNSLTQIPDLAGFFAALRPLCTPQTRIVQLSYNYMLAPVIRLAHWLRLAPWHPVPNWLTRYDIDNLAMLEGYQTVRDGYAVSFPFRVPLLSRFLNTFCPLVPGIRLGCLTYFSVLRPLFDGLAAETCTVSVCVPCKDEREHIAGLVERIPDLGAGTEIIFVDDQSTDGTGEEIERQRAAHPGRKIKLVKGPGQGKGAACRAGFASAEHDVLMILDADMTVMPEELPAFFDALLRNRGEFINGSRLVYPLEEDAMRFANIIGNKLFAMLFSVILSQRIKDTLCGTKVIWRRDYEKLMHARSDFGGVDKWGDYDWIFGAARYNLKIAEVPVHYRKRFAGQSKMTRRLRNALIMLRMCWIGFWKVRVIS